ncbi:unnamed protein product [Rotaria socialis]|uniref:Coactosin-like protein n=1 Tax=Rotaria socialis TaxID=392032 RepID=A0A820Q457_9BILA|nr:unnamed protein product [Rotaria socialis]CAF3382123.1 unnamed protein product [Rotaria socialis]CAF3515389.1 unnamed protein product [Rotaria socialis]CAF3568982.1 unnamed protein product [Rotaria socialis]CAF3732342.1 unnamed protein product [Rotaria socialis]
MAGPKRSVDLSSVEIQEAWQQVRNDASDDNWILLSYGDNGDIVLSGKGTGGLIEMKTQLNENQVYYGVARVRAVDDHGSKRAKFVFITYVGTGVTPIRRARVSTHKHEFERFFNGYHIQVYANSEDDLSEESITASLHACAGAHKPQAYEFS